MDLISQQIKWESTPQNYVGKLLLFSNNLIVLEKIKHTLSEKGWRTDEHVLQFLAKMYDLEIPSNDMSLKPGVWTKFCIWVVGQN